MAIGAITGAMEGLGNLVTGGTWSQSGGEIARQNWEAEQAAIARSFSAVEAEKARQFNMTEAQKQRDFEEQMSNSAYQRAASDMRAAGLNPYLAYSLGGAGTPSGVAASSPTAQGFTAGGNKASSSNATAQFIGAIVGATAKLIATKMIMP